MSEIVMATSFQTRKSRKYSCLRTQWKYCFLSAVVDLNFHISLAFNNYTQGGFTHLIEILFCSGRSDRRLWRRLCPEQEILIAQKSHIYNNLQFFLRSSARLCYLLTGMCILVPRLLVLDLVKPKWCLLPLTLKLAPAWKLWSSSHSPNQVSQLGWSCLGCIA